MGKALLFGVWSNDFVPESHAQSPNHGFHIDAVLVWEAKDIAIVDVGQIYIHGKAKNQVTTLIK